MEINPITNTEWRFIKKNRKAQNKGTLQISYRFEDGRRLGAFPGKCGIIELNLLALNI